MRNIKRAGVLMAAALSTLFIGATAAAANHGGPHCDELPANITPEHPAWDDSLDTDHDGVGCEDESQPPWTPPETPPATEPPVTDTPTTAPSAPAPAPAAPAEPVVEAPDFTG